MQNGYIESFNGRMRDELLNETLFFNLDQARQVIGDWVADYNIGQPHSSTQQAITLGSRLASRAGLLLEPNHTM
jgi:transposase InsO family protein